ncbi:hypothetical protein OAE48_03050 [Flavobacteriales bacterium]|nr:hypothetical protein [Flavobacteriales bacterium]
MNSLKMVFVSKVSLSVCAVAVVLLSGCSRCEECNYASSSETICETEFDNSSQFEDAVADAEANGASCTSVGRF